MMRPCTGTAETAWRTAKPLHGCPAPAGPPSGTGRYRRASSFRFRPEKRPAHAGASQGPRRKGRGAAPPFVLSESGQLSFGRLAVERCARIFDRPAEGLPRLADDLFIGGDCALGRSEEPTSELQSLMRI